MQVIGLREHPEYFQAGLAYIKRHWANEQSAPVFDDCISHSLTTPQPLPRWYGLEEGGRLIGCAGRIPNDYVSRMDLWPWLCALYVEEDCRGHNLGKLIIDRVKQEAAAAGFPNVYLVTDHIGYYEPFGFTYIGMGFHPWGETSRIDEADTP